MNEIKKELKVEASKRKKRSLAYYYSLFTIGLVLLFLLLIAYWSFYPYQIITFGKDNGKILTPVVKAGGYVQMQQDYCKYQNLISIIDRQFVDSIVYQVPNTRARRLLGCHKFIEYIYVPPNLPPATYHITTGISFQVNPIRTVTTFVTTGKFQIIE